MFDFLIYNINSQFQILGNLKSLIPLIIFVFLCLNTKVYAKVYLPCNVAGLIKESVLQDSIERYRKGDVLLRIFDTTSRTLTNAIITINQISHDFLFAGNPMGKYNQYNPIYASLLKQAGINYSYIISTWGSIEPQPGRFEWGAIDSYQNISAQQNNGFDLMGALAFWMYRGSGLGDQFFPTYLDGMNFDELKNTLYNHMYTLVTRYKDYIKVWEFNEQNSSWTNPLNLTWRQKLELCKVAAKGVKDADPEAKILYDANALPDEFSWPSTVNLDDTANGVKFPEFLHMLSKNEIPYDIIGLEFYYAGCNTDGYSPPSLSISELSNIIDLYSSFGKIIFIRELSAPSKQVTGSSMWNGPWNEELQAEYLRQVYTMAFSKPMVQEIGWSYGISDEDSYIVSGGILNENLQPKMSYYTLQNLTQSWKTSGSGKTDERGEYSFKGFAGDYDMTVSLPGFETLSTKIHIEEQKENDFTITLRDKTYSLTVNATHGTVTKNPDQASYNHGTSVQLTATPSTGYHFVNWSGDASGTQNPLTVTMDANKTITVNFAINTYTTTASAGANGTITPSGSVSVNYGANQTFTITPSTNYKVDSVIVDGVKVDSSTSYTFRNVTTGHTIYVSFKLTTSVKELNVAIPTEYFLFQNYPNPFNPSTIIRYDLPKEGMVSIKIYDMLGIEVKTLVNEYKSAGIYNIEFNASNLTSGIYFYKLTLGNITQAKKMLLLK